MRLRVPLHVPVRVRRRVRVPVRMSSRVLSCAVLVVCHAVWELDGRVRVRCPPRAIVR